LGSPRPIFSFANRYQFEINVATFVQEASIAHP